MWKQDKLVEAEGFLREALEIVRNSSSDQEPDLNRTLNHLGTVLRLQGKLKDAEVLLREAVKNSNAALGKTPPFLPVLLRNQATAYAGLAATLLDGGKFNEAESIAREGLATAEKELPNDWLTFSIRSVLGASLLGQNKSTEAGPLLVSAYEGLDQRWEKIEQANKFPVGEAIKRLIKFYESTDRPEQTAEWKQKLADYYKAVSQPKPAGATL
jgi:tetratricopeptide (TPR) repeat protein